MNNNRSYFFLAILVLFSFQSYAQNGIFAGKIVDEYNRPVPGAVIKVSRHDMQPIEIVSDSEGVYSTKYVAEGNYYLDVFAGGKYRGETELLIDTTSASKKFFLIKVHSRKFAINALDNDPVMAVKLKKAQDACMPIPQIQDTKAGTYMYMLKVDTTKERIDTIKSPTPVQHAKSTRR